MDGNGGDSVKLEALTAPLPGGFGEKVYGTIESAAPLSQDAIPVQPNVDEEANVVASSDEVVKCYARPEVQHFTSYWRKRLLGVEDWILVNYDALPDWLKDNDCIISGNRPPLGWRPIMQSLFYLHNQTGNIYSHLVCGLAMTGLMIYTFVGLLARQSGVTPFEYLSWAIFFFCAQWVVYVSAGFHLTLCHSRKTAFIGGCLDYTGIVFMIYGSLFLALFYAYQCNTTWMYIYIGAFSGVAIGCAVSMYIPVMNTPKMRPWRSALFCVFGLVGAIPLVHFVAVVGAAEASQYGLVYMILEGIIYILGACLFATRFPERLAPGRFDYWGHSHQFHHVCSGAGGFLHWYAMYLAFQRSHSAPCPWP